MLETDVRNVPERHRSIRAVFDYSWEHMKDSEQEIVESRGRLFAKEIVLPLHKQQVLHFQVAGREVVVP